MGRLSAFCTYTNTRQLQLIYNPWISCALQNQKSPFAIFTLQFSPLQSHLTWKILQNLICAAEQYHIYVPLQYLSYVQNARLSSLNFLIYIYNCSTTSNLSSTSLLLSCVITMTILSLIPKIMLNISFAVSASRLLVGSSNTRTS